jgi:hypothetical protein
VITNTWTPPPAPPTPQKRKPGKVVARVIGGSILGLAVFGFMHGGFKSDQVSTATTQPTASAEGTPTSAAVDGFTFTPPANDYSVVFPNEPATHEQMVRLPDGSDAPLTLYLSVASDRAFETGAFTYPPGTVHSLDAGRDGSVAKVSGTLTSSTPITLQGRAGLQYTARTHNGQATYLARVYDDDVNSYQVIAVVAGEATFDDPQIAAFFDSFRFTVDR